MKIRQSQRATDRETEEKGKKLQVSKGWRRRGKKKQEGGIGGTDEQVRSLAQGGVRKVFGWMGGRGRRGGGEYAFFHLLETCLLDLFCWYVLILLLHDYLLMNND
ncbi:hypothetical protein H0G86_008596 [Trichoderma simmonsii]|uniref:Uncharacterized protein n=1 Tax=Trichoderma simmonsii TaxID=1491479 RepID=A0A8G0LIQ7_9HYPO|nr:hypothetical protein H0G86_008596 [Trichoderma simmonsii]